ncbi:hypothetical protein HDU76_009085, partial [Blyttiomyces sp. JEL0837]
MASIITKFISMIQNMLFAESDYIPRSALLGIFTTSQHHHQYHQPLTSSPSSSSESTNTITIAQATTTAATATLTTATFPFTPFSFLWTLLSVLFNIIFYSLTILGFIAVIIVLALWIISMFSKRKETETETTTWSESVAVTTGTTGGDRAETVAGSINKSNDVINSVGVSSKGVTSGGVSSLSESDVADDLTVMSSASVKANGNGGAVVAATTSGAVTTTSGKADKSKRLSMSKRVSETLSDAAVTTAIMLKQSPIPDTLAQITGTALSGFNRIDSAFHIQDRLVGLSQEAVRTGVVAAGIAASAAIKAGIAYQTTPGYKDLMKLSEAMQKSQAASTSTSTSTSNDPTAISSSTTLTISSLQPTSEPAGPRLRIMRIESIPGGIPFPDLIECSTQTDASLTGFVLAPSNGKSSSTSTSTSTTTTPSKASLACICPECGKGIQIPNSALEPVSRDLALRSFDSSSSSQQQNSSSSTTTSTKPSLFSNVLSGTASVAAILLTKSSNYVFGEEATRKLLGDEFGSMDSPQNSEEAALDAEYEIALEGPIRNVVVGGINFVTTVGTLTRDPGSKLARWFAAYPVTSSSSATTGGGDGNLAAATMALSKPSMSSLKHVSSLQGDGTPTPLPTASVLAQRAARRAELRSSGLLARDGS